MTVTAWVVLAASLVFVGLVIFGIRFRERVITERALYMHEIDHYRDPGEETDR